MVGGMKVFLLCFCVVPLYIVYVLINTRITALRELVALFVFDYFF
jgi:hypothetical protein